MTVRYRFFVALASFFLLVNLLVMNDFTTLWAGAESLLAWQSMNGESGVTPHELLQSIIMGAEQVPHFGMRLPGVLIFVLALGAYWGISRKLLGSEVLVSTLLVLGASLLIPNLAKAATGDIWAMTTQWLAFAVLIRFLKQPSLLWRVVFYGLLWLAVWVQAANALIFLMGSSAFLYFLHPEGKRLWSLNPWGAGLLVFLLLYFTQLLTFSQDGFLAGFRASRFLLWNLIGILPFLGFVLAGIWETAQRVGRREEMAILNAAGLIFALLGHSWALQGIFALLAARQLKNYFDPNYPYGPAVKAGALLHLVAAFFVLTPLMVGSFLQFRAPGFRAMLATGGIYWMLSFTAVIGLFGPNRRYLYGGVILGGLLLTTMFWLQLNPLLQQKMSWPRVLVQQSMQDAEVDESMPSFLVHQQKTPFPVLAPYSKAAFPQTALLNGSDNLQQVWDTSGTAVFLLELSDAEKLKAATPRDSITGWDSRLRSVDYILLVKKSRIQIDQEE